MNQHIVDFEHYIDGVSPVSLNKSCYCKILGLHRVSYAQIKSGKRPLLRYVHLHMDSIMQMPKSTVKKIIIERTTND